MDAMVYLSLDQQVGLGDYWVEDLDHLHHRVCLKPLVTSGLPLYLMIPYCQDHVQLRTLIRLLQSHHSTVAQLWTSVHYSGPGHAHYPSAKCDPLH